MGKTQKSSLGVSQVLDALLADKVEFDPYALVIGIDDEKL